MNEWSPKIAHIMESGETWKERHENLVSELLRDVERVSAVYSSIIDIQKRFDESGGKIDVISELAGRKLESSVPDKLMRDYHRMQELTHIVLNTMDTFKHDFRLGL